MGIILTDKAKPKGNVGKKLIAPSNGGTESIKKRGGRKSGTSSRVKKVLDHKLNQNRGILARRERVCDSGLCELAL